MGIKKTQASPLLDFDFLYKLDKERNRTTYARITSLTLEGYPVERIEGIVTAGSITLDGGSAVRRVCDLTLTTSKLNINNIYWGLTTKVKIEIGLENNLYNKGYSKYGDIIWFPQGIYILTNFKTSAQVNSYTITLNGKDKMCLLNGDIGGNFNAETQLDTERIQQEDGTWIDEKKSIAYIIREMIHHYAQEPFHNIVIKDIDKLSLKMLNNRVGTFYLVYNPLSEQIVDIYNNDFLSLWETNKVYYYYSQPAIVVDFRNLDKNFVFYSTSGEDNIGLIDVAPTFIIDRDNIKYVVIAIEEEDDIGYQLTETYYPDELIAGVNETITSILDKIINTFGDFEYFYNLQGQFVFQAKQTYVNTAWNSMITIEKDNEEGTYIEPEMVSKKIKYSFEGSKLTTAYQNSPELDKIKNDFTVWGKKKTGSGIELPIHMRYAIDNKPYFYSSFEKEGYTIFKSGIQLDIQPYHDVYVSVDYYNSTIKNSMEIIKNNYIKKHRITKSQQVILNKKYPPQCLCDAISDEYVDPNLYWWTVEDWGKYYNSLLDSYPKDSIKLSSYKTLPMRYNITFSARNTFKPSEIGQYIIDLDSETNQPFTAIIDGKAWDPYQHTFKNCNCTYETFMHLHNEFNVDSWIYRPSMPDGTIIYDTPIFSDYLIHVVDWREIIYQMAKDYYLHNHDDDFYVKVNRNNTIPEFNVILFQNGRTGYEQYYHDIEGFWRLLYAPKDYVDQYDVSKAKLPAYTINKDDFYDDYGYYIGPWNKYINEEPSDLIFWFDFFEAESLGLGQFSVPAIGDRPKNENNDSIRALIYKSVPNLILISQEDYDNYNAAGRLLDGYDYWILNNTMKKYIEDNKIRISSRSVTAQEAIDNLLYNNAYCNETITITSIPIYYLEPNTIISARDEERMVHGYYIINKVTLPLDYKGTMQITAIKVPERTQRIY